MKFNKRTITAITLACLTAFAASAQASPRAVTPPKITKGTVATAAANSIKKAKDDKAAATKPAATKAKAAKKTPAKAGTFNTKGLPKDYKKIGIFGEAKATPEQAAALIYLNNPDPQLNCSVDELVHLYWDEAGREGVREDLALAQAIVETGFFSFTGDVKPEQNNFCGLGTTGGGVEGEYFDEPEIGVRAHIQHLLAYTTKKHPSTDEKIMRTYQNMLDLDKHDLKEAEKAKAEYLKNYMGSHKDEDKDKDKDKETKPEHKLTMRERVEKILKEGK